MIPQQRPERDPSNQNNSSLQNDPEFLKNKKNV